MEKAKAKESSESAENSLRNLQLDNNTIKSKSNQTSIAFTLPSQFLSSIKGKKPPSLLSLCLGVVGRNLEDITDDLAEIALAFPYDIKLVLVAIARRRKLLNDDILIALADSSWETLDISGSDVSDSGLCHIVDICHNLKAVDISRCSRLTSVGVSKLVQLCYSLQILRWGLALVIGIYSSTREEESTSADDKSSVFKTWTGREELSLRGCPRSDYTARRCLSLLKPNLNDVEGESWEELDAAELTHGAQSLRWLVWPKIDKDSQETLSIECPRIVANPKPYPLGFRGTEVPQEALMQFALDDPIVKDIDPQTWAISGSVTSRAVLLPVAPPNELSMAEKFRLAFAERDTRLAPKRAKNARQHQRRAERERVMMDTRAKALALASKATKSVNVRNL